MRNAKRAIGGMVRGAVAGLAAVLASQIAASSAEANNVANVTPITGGTTYFGALHTDDLDFTDVFTFSVAGSVLSNMSLTTISAGANNIDFLSADLNGVALTLTPNGFFETGINSFGFGGVNAVLVLQKNYPSLFITSQPFGTQAG